MARTGYEKVSMVFRVHIPFFFALAYAANAAKAEEKASYAPGDAIPVSCLNRTV
jgi:hypothetical protein